MRIVPNEERIQRGCKYCLEHRGRGCKYDVCPYHELDDVKTYEEYLDEKGFVFDQLVRNLSSEDEGESV